MASTRVYILAKELGVKSTAIVEKCQNEDLDVKNHMSAISAGLAATIREWFSEGDNVTTVETAKKVDLKKVRLQKKPKLKSPAKKSKDKKAKPVPPTEPASETAATAEMEPAEPEPTETLTTLVAIAEEPKPTEEQVAKKLQKEEPEPILPAGPIMEKPEPARLNGPQIVRV